METIAIMRMVQLILGVMAGFGCIYLGYRLFALAMTRPNSGKFKIPGFGEVNLRAAPGIFFAVIGAIIIWVCVARPFSITNNADTRSPERMFFKCLSSGFSSKC